MYLLYFLLSEELFFSFSSAAKLEVSNLRGTCMLLVRANTTVSNPLFFGVARTDSLELPSAQVFVSISRLKPPIIKVNLGYGKIINFFTVFALRTRKKQ